MIRRLPRTLHAVALAGIAVAGLACGDAREGPDGADRPLRRRDPASGPVTPARYGTDLTFVAFAPDGPRLHYRFRHVTSAGRLRRRYGLRSLDRDGWTELLSVRDTLPTPRAGWRVLPAPGLRVIAAPGGGLRAVVRGDSARSVRLALGRTLARWQSPAGRRERFRLAAVVADGRRWPGLAVERRSAVAAAASAPRGLHGFLLVADSTGRGLVVLRRGGTAPGRPPPDVDTTAVAYAWTARGERTWREVRLAAARDTPSDGRGPPSPPPRGWLLTVPAAGVRGRFRVEALEEVAPGPVLRRGEAGTVSDGRGPVRLYGLSGTLSVDGDLRPVRGVGVEAGKP